MGSTTITVNGKSVSVPAEEALTVAKYLQKNQYQTNRIAVELNGAILPKTEYASVRLSDGDTLEIVSFVGGG